MTEREAFEEKMCHKLVGVFDNDLNCYTELTDQLVLEAWQAAKVQIAKLQAGTKWILVKDALPPNDSCNREYWVYETLTNKVQHDYWVCPDSELDQDFKPFFNNWFGSVTHWMPMVKYPSPPIQEQEQANESE